MSFIKKFSEIFIPTHAAHFSLYTRTMIPTIIGSTSLISTLNPFHDKGILFTVYGFVILLIFMYITKTLRKILNALLLPFIFIALGLLINFISMILKLTTPPLYSLILSSFKISLIFISFSLFFQLISFKEMRFIMKILGLKWLARILSISIVIMPIIFNNYAESYMATLLKLGRRKVYKAVKPLIIQTAILALDITQVLYFYGFPSDVELSVSRPGIKEILLIIFITITAIVFLIFTF